jgi:nitroreductase
MTKTESPAATRAALLDVLEQLVRSRRAIRHFRPDPLPDGLLLRLLDLARWAPSGYNLQPAHFVIVTDPDRKAALHGACMSQRQILEAPAIVVFVGDRRVYQTNFEPMLQAERDAGTLSPQYESLLRQFVPLAFEQGPLGVGWLWKALIAPLGRFFAPIPSIPAVWKEVWLTKQVALAAMNFMLAATAAGLATVPMEGFDAVRVRRALDIPRWGCVVLVVPLGYASEESPSGKTRFDLSRMTHRERW